MSVQELFFALAMVVLTATVAVLGTASLAAHRITINALSLAFLPGYGLAIAGSTLIGQAVGARDRETARRAGRVAAEYATLWMGAIAVIFFVFATQIVRLFSTDPAVVDVGTDALRALAIAQPFWALLIVYEGALRGLGNARYPMVLNTISTWTAAGLALVLIRVYGFGLAAAWMMFALVAGPGAWFIWRKFVRTPLPDPVLARLPVSE
jgi:Na+-driven multidrug efflux pump